MNYISQHAKERFKERYNFELPNLDYLLSNSVKQISFNKKGHIVNNKNRGIYRCMYDNKIIEYVLSIHKNGDKVICTFNHPPKTFNEKCLSYKEIEE